jgi:CRP/FNR family transcriptional regulator
VTPAAFDRLVAAYPALAHVPTALAADLVATARPFTCAPSDLLFDTGAPCDGLPLLLAGTVRVSRRLANGQDVPLYRVGRGELCALSLHALLSRTPHVARAQAVDEAAGVLVAADALHALLEAEAGFRRHVVGALASRVAGLVATVEQVSAVRLDERLARLLVERGPVLAVTHQALADELGTAREVVSRILEGFGMRGAVRLRRGRVEVLDPTRLAPGPRVPVPRTPSPASSAHMTG